MVLVYQLFAEVIVLLSSFVLFELLMKKFNVKKQTQLLVFFPLAAFAIGYYLRLSDVKGVIDTGYFLTDFSYLFVYLLFALSFILGQLKYWKKN